MTQQQIHPTIRAFISERQAQLHKTDAQVAEAVGDVSERVYALMKTGAIKIPYDKVMPMAAALHVPQEELLGVLLQDYSSDLMTLIRSFWSMSSLSKAERKLVEAFRSLAGGRDVEPLIMDGLDVIALVTA